MANSGPKNWSKTRYSTAAKRLRSLGYNVALRGNKTASPQQKAAVRRLWNKKAVILKFQHGVGEKRILEQIRLDSKGRATYKEVREKGKRAKVVLVTQPKEYGFVFKKLTRSEMRAMKKILPKSQFTPTGVFIEKPARVLLKNFSFKVVDGALEVKAGKNKETILPLDPIKLAQNPELAVKEAIGKRKPKHVRVMVSGFHGKKDMTTKEFYYYSSAVLPDRFDSLDEEGRAEDGVQVTERFNLVLTY